MKQLEIALQLVLLFVFNISGRLVPLEEWRKHYITNSHEKDDITEVTPFKHDKQCKGNLRYCIYLAWLFMLSLFSYAFCKEMRK